MGADDTENLLILWLASEISSQVKAHAILATVSFVDFSLSFFDKNEWAVLSVWDIIIFPMSKLRFVWKMHGREIYMNGAAVHHHESIFSQNDRTSSRMLLKASDAPEHANVQ